jgi:hypothetical protein
MKIFFFCSIILVTFAARLAKAEDAKAKQEQTQAEAYFKALVTAEVEQANALVAVPFSLDRKKVLKTLDEVHAAHQRIAGQKGKRPVPEFTISRTEVAPALDAAVFPKYVAYRLIIAGKEHIDIYVSIGETPKVLGFSD